MDNRRRFRLLTLKLDRLVRVQTLASVPYELGDLRQVTEGLWILTSTVVLRDQMGPCE